MDYTNNTKSWCSYKLNKIYLLIKRHGDFLSMKKGNWEEVNILEVITDNSNKELVDNHKISCITKDNYGQNNIKLECKINNLITKNNTTKLDIFIDESKQDFIPVNINAGAILNSYFLSNTINKFYKTLTIR